MYKFISFVILTIVILVLSSAGTIGADTIEGFITNVDIINNGVFIGSTSYIVSDDCSMKLNNKNISLNGLRPPYQDFYKWAVLNINDNGIVTDICSYYRVAEGEIKEISFIEGWLIISEYKQEPSLKKSADKYYFSTEFNNRLMTFKEHDHIVLVTALNQILYLP